MKCPECGKRGLSGPQGVAMHIARVHTKTIVSPGGPRGPRKPREPITAIDTEPPASRRIVETLLESNDPEPSRFNVNACPNCSFPLQVMNEALATRGIQPPPHCPQCTCPVEAIRTALRVSAKHDHKLNGQHKRQLQPV